MANEDNLPVSQRPIDVKVEPGAPSEQELKAGTVPTYQTSQLRSMSSLHLVVSRQNRTLLYGDRTL